MIRWFVGLAFVIAVVGCGAPSSSSKSPASGASEPPELAQEWEAEYAEVSAALALSGEEQTRLHDAYVAMEADLGAWLASADGKRLMVLEAEMRDAVETKNLPALKAITDEAKGLRAEFGRRIDAGRESLVMSLDPPNQAAWRGYRLSSHMLDLMAPLELDGGQEAAIRESAAVAMEQAIGRGEPNPPAAAFVELEKWAEANVLSAAQVAQYAEVKRSKPMRTLTF